MINSGNADHGRNVITRWRLLTERRLNYLIDLYESGRWKVYYDENQFRAAIHEARAALRTWESLAAPAPVQDKPVEVAVVQEGNSAIAASPFMDVPSANGVGAKHDLRKL